MAKWDELLTYIANQSSEFCVEDVLVEGGGQAGAPNDVGG
jgi:hypothetical protein